MNDESCQVCGGELGGPFCGHCGAWNGEGDPPTLPDQVCPVCGTVNAASNKHCQACAFLLRRRYEPPSTRSSLSLILIGGVVLFAGLAAVLIINQVVGGDQVDTTRPATASSSTTPTGVSGSTVPQLEIAPIPVASVSASSSFNESFSPANLTDDDPDTYWNDASRNGEGAELVFEFSSPAAIEQIVIQNVMEETAFRRNYRIRGYEITTDDLPAPITGELADSNDPQTVRLTTTSTTRLVLRVTSTYAAESTGDQAPFEELAVAEVIIYGAAARE